MKKKRGETVTKRANINKSILRVQKTHTGLSNIRLEYLKSVVDRVVKTKPQFITIEDLNVAINPLQAKEYTILCF